MGIVSTIYNRTVNTDKPAKVLCFPHNGHFDMSLLDTGHDFYFVRNSSACMWPRFEKHGAPNFHIIDDTQIHQGFDVVIFNSRQNQKALIDRYAYELQIPSIVVDHIPVNLNPYLTKQLYNSQPFTSIQCYEGKTDIRQILYTVAPNDYTNATVKDIDVLFTNTITRDKVSIVQTILGQYPVEFFGNPFAEAPNLKPKSTDTYQDYKNLFARAKIFIHLPSHLGFSHELIWALNYGCWILGLSDASVTQDIKNHPLYISATADLASSIKQLLSKSPPSAPLLYNNDYNQYIKEWKDLISEHQKRVYHHENNN